MVEIPIKMGNSNKTAMKKAMIKTIKMVVMMGMLKIRSIMIMMMMKMQMQIITTNKIMIRAIVVLKNTVNNKTKVEAKVTLLLH